MGSLTAAPQASTPPNPHAHIHTHTHAPARGGGGEYAIGERGGHTPGPRPYQAEMRVERVLEWHAKFQGLRPTAMPPYPQGLESHAVSPHRPAGPLGGSWQCTVESCWGMSV